MTTSDLYEKHLIKISPKGGDKMLRSYIRNLVYVNLEQLLDLIAKMLVIL